MDFGVIATVTGMILQERPCGQTTGIAPEEVPP